ncbi:MAG: hypothetical protein AAF630_17305 [Cyanobacteria bacterium P01_C01_bin.38]
MRRQGENQLSIINYQLLITNPPCPMPNSQFLTPHSLPSKEANGESGGKSIINYQSPMPNSQFPIPYSLLPTPYYSRKPTWIKPN